MCLPQVKHMVQSHYWAAYREGNDVNLLNKSSKNKDVLIEYIVI